MEHVQYSGLVRAHILCAIAITGSLHAYGATPLTADANTIELDHFDGSTKGTAFGNPEYVPSLSGLGQALNLTKGTYVQYTVLSTLEKAGTFEVLVKVGQLGQAVEILNLNWNNTTSYPPAGHVLHFVLNADGLQCLRMGEQSGDMYLSTTAQVPLGTFVHLALSWSSAGAKIYIAGAVVAASSQPFSRQVRNMLI